MEPCTQENRITRIENTVGEIGSKVNTIAADVTVIRASTEAMAAKVEEHDRALYGNNGNVGVVAKVVQSVEKLEDLAIALRGKGEEPGLIAEIRNLMNYVGEQKDERKWMTRAVIGVVIAQLLGLLFMLLK